MCANYCTMTTRSRISTLSSFLLDRFHLVSFILFKLRMILVYSSILVFLHSIFVSQRIAFAWCMDVRLKREK